MKTYTRAFSCDSFLIVNLRAHDAMDLYFPGNLDPPGTGANFNSVIFIKNMPLYLYASKKTVWNMSMHEII